MIEMKNDRFIEISQTKSLNDLFFERCVKINFGGI
jgi:hypothetical protein